MDNAASHMAQTMAGVKPRRNPMFDIIARHGKAQLGGKADVKLVYLPSMAPEFNPCERINALLKRFLEHGNNKRFSEQVLVSQIKEFFAKMPGPSLFNIIRGCGYKFEHDVEHHQRLKETLHIADDSNIEQRLSDMCNNPEPSDPQNMPLADRYYRRRHVLCVDANTGQLVKYFSPLSLNINNMYKKRPSWVFISKHETLFNNALVPIHASMADSQKMLERIDAVKNVEVRYSGYDVPDIKGFALESRDLCLKSGAPEIYSDNNAINLISTANNIDPSALISCCDFWDMFMQASLNGVISGISSVSSGSGTMKDTGSAGLLDVIWILEAQGIGIILRMRKTTSSTGPFGLDSVLLKHSLILKGHQDLLERFIDKKLRQRSNYVYILAQTAVIKEKMQNAQNAILRKDFIEGSGWIVPIAKPLAMLPRERQVDKRKARKNGK